MDFPTAWALVNATSPADHDPRCSFAQTRGALLCDCHVLNSHLQRTDDKDATVSDSQHLTEQHRQAQAAAVSWAHRAETEYTEAVRHEDDARARQHHDSGWQRDRMAEERRLAQFHGTRSVEAVKLAEMWARVATALQPATPSIIVAGERTLTREQAKRLEDGVTARLVDAARTAAAGA